MRENDFIAWLAEKTPPSSSVRIGIGDDMAAVELPVRAGDSLALALLKIDQSLDGVHFDLRRHTPAQAGRKAVNRCLSDCAAMACRPAAVLLAVALPHHIEEEVARELFIGGQAAATAFNCPVVGGDTAIWDQRLAISVAALGAATGPLLRRNQARPGDALCVTGNLGGSLLGRHLNFTPRIDLAQRLAAVVDIHAMMDISDSLAIDLPRLAQASGVGAVVYRQSLPIHQDARMLSAQDGRPDWFHALCDGEDYELLFALDEAHAHRILQLPGDDWITVIGQVTDGREITLRNEDGTTMPWPQAGWEYRTGA